MNQITFFGILSIIVICDGSCLTGTRRVVLADGSEDCVFCKECPTGQVVARACSDQGDTICCPLKTYLPPTEIKQRCTNCSVCDRGKYVSRLCSLTEDAVCSDCPNGTFTDANNSLTCHNCTKECEHGVQAHCSRSSDTICKENRPNFTTIVVLCIVVVTGILSFITLCQTIKYRQRRNKRSNDKYKEGKTTEPLVDCRETEGGKEKSINSIGTDNSKQMNCKMSIDPESRNVKMKILERESETGNSSVASQQTETNTDRGIPSRRVGPETVIEDGEKERAGKRDGARVANQQKERNAVIDIAKNRASIDPEMVIIDVKKMAAEEFKTTSSIGVLFDTVAKRNWPVFRVGKSFVMTSIDAYDCMKVVRNGQLGSKIQNASVQFASTKAAFAVLTSDIFVDDKLGVLIIKLEEEFELPPPLSLDTSPVQKGAIMQIHTSQNDLKIQTIVAKLDKIDKNTIESMIKHFKKQKSNITKVGNKYNVVKTIEGKNVTLTNDDLKSDLPKYEQHYCFTGTPYGIRPGSPVCLASPGQELKFVGVCTKTIPWFFQYLNENEYDLLKGHAYHVFTSFSDIQSELNEELHQQIFE